MRNARLKNTNFLHQNMKIQQKLAEYDFLEANNMNFLNIRKYDSVKIYLMLPTTHINSSLRWCHVP